MIPFFAKDYYDFKNIFLIMKLILLSIILIIYVFFEIIERHLF